MLCRDCPRFDPETEQCRDRKINPQSWENTIQVAQTFGVRAICVFNHHRERLVATREPLRGPNGASGGSRSGNH